MPGIWGHTAREFSFCVLPLFPTHTEDRDHVPVALRPRSLVTRAGAAAWDRMEKRWASPPMGRCLVLPEGVCLSHSTVPFV